MKLILHIGTEKTGTTSFQAWGAQNRAALRARGIHYPTSLGQARHIKLSVASASAHEEGKLEFRVHNIASQEDLEGFRDRIVRAFQAEMHEVQAQGDCTTCVISDEGLQANLTTPDEARRVRDLVMPFHDDVEVVVALRPQVDYAVSLASTLIRLGNKIGQDWFNALSPQVWRFDYDTLVRNWEEAFGAEKLQVVPYRRAPDSISVFAGKLGLDPADFDRPERKNAFIDWRTLRVINSLGPEKSRIFRRLAPSFGAREPLQIGAELAGEISARFAQSNAALVARRPELEAGDLEPDMARYAKPENLSLLTKKIPQKNLPQAVFDAMFR